MRGLAAERQVDRLHHPQAARGAGRRRPDHRAAARRGGRDAAPGRGDRAALATMMVGRPVELASTRTRPRPARRRAECRACGVLDERGHVAVDGRRPDGAGRRDRRHRRRRGERPDRARGGADRAGSPLAAGRVDARRATSPGHATPDRPGRGRPHPRGPPEATAWSWRTSLADNLVLTHYDEPPFAHGFRRMAQAIVRVRRCSWSRSSTCARRRPGPDRHALGRQPAEGGGRPRARVGPRLLIAAQPTRGVDVGATELIHRRIVAARDGARRVLLVSARARRDAGPGRPHRRDLPRPDHGAAGRQCGEPRRARAADRRGRAGSLREPDTQPRPGPIAMLPAEIGPGQHE